MKILHFGRFYNSNFGGVERHVELLLEGLKDKVDVDNIVANDNFRSTIINKSGYNIYKAASFGKMFSVAICPAMLYWARKLNNVKHYDIVHLHFPDPLSSLAVYCLSKNVRLVITWHSDIIRQKILLIFYRPFLKNILKRADAIIAATPKHFTSSTQLAGSANDRHFVVPYGINLKSFEKTQAISNEVASIRCTYQGKKIIFAIGRHVYYKGFEYLIKAMVHVRESILLLGGTGPLSDHLKALVISSGVADKVFFLGRVPDEVLPAYYYASDIFCMPSVEPSEAFGLVQLEAMACKKPVVCCELNNGVTYVNQHDVTGLVVPPYDVHALSAALNDLVSDPEKCNRLGEAGYLRVSTEYSIDLMVKGTLQVYQHVLSQSNP